MSFRKVIARSRIFPPGRIGSIRPGNAAFSLLELLCVLAVMAILVALAVTPFSNARSTSLTTAGNLVMEDMAYARELAIANNQPVEVWFLRPTGGTSIDGLQIYLVDQIGNSSSYGGVHHLPKSIGIDSGTALSPLFATSNKKTFGGSVVQPTIPGYGTNYQAWSVRFMPDGSTTLPSTQQWFVTLHDVTAGDALALSSGQIPSSLKNYAVVSVDPLAGNVSLYRP